ncbi:MAG: hypothetical protein A2Z68_02560 [Candidatus Nealsonbacteria bacterium RBG_13_38_11]|uniref:4-vinyl reductase 4VR domain-containing protein n=1 Tax=Candidatus Nealsonbacteria bacterium RBG_13_38_11 TaxID=1801662 RepID=A0A1G2DXU5_9BACT|nr:MAG: hypothetical protein A2Z68_02560 [Candidatus Nealsonbacteria bacterium RBG_13_38_11]
MAENNQNLEEKVKELTRIKGEVRGVAFKTDMEFILKEKGEEGLKKLEIELEKAGFPINYKAIKAMDFYPVGLRVISLLIIKKTFNFDDKQIKDMGVFAAKVSLIIKLFVKYFFSTQRVFFKEAPKMWDKHYTISKLIPIELDEEKKYAILQIEDLVLDSIFCNYLGGYFCSILQMVVSTNKIDFQETKCPFHGDKYHEYLLKWQ